MEKTTSCIYVVRRVHFDGSDIQRVPVDQYYDHDPVLQALVFRDMDDARKCLALLWQKEEHFQATQGYYSGDFESESYEIECFQVLEGDAAESVLAQVRASVHAAITELE